MNDTLPTQEPPTTPSGEQVGQHPLVLPSFRVLLSRLEGRQEWSIVANPSWNHFTRAQSAILENELNEYSEYLNCGVVHRMIRAEDWPKYGTGQVAKAWALDPRQNVKHTGMQWRDTLLCD